MDLTLDVDGSFRRVRGYTVGPVISRDARRPTPDEPHPVEGSSPRDPESEEVATESHDIGDPFDPSGPGAPGSPVDPATRADTRLATAQLGGRRRTRRLVTPAVQVAGDPSSGLPEQTRDRGDLKAAYRLLDRPEVTLQAIASPHGQLIAGRAAGRFRILDDTTEIDFGPTRQAAGLGPIGSGVGRGYLIHSGLMVDVRDEWIGGPAGQILFHRWPAPDWETRAQRRHRERESAVWGQSIERIGPPPAQAQWVHVMDRRADDFEVHCRAQRLGADWIGRVKSRHRRVRDEAGHEGPLSGALARAPVAGDYVRPLPARPGRKARRARIAVSFAAVEVLVLRQPAESLKAPAPGPIARWAVWAREVDAPAGVKGPIDGLLLTSPPVWSPGEAMEVIGYDEEGWIMEEWHEALKTGCQVEGRQWETGERPEALTGLLSAVAVRLSPLKGVARREPRRAALESIPRPDVESVCRARGRGQPERWTVRDFFRGVAGLGGFLGRKGDGNPVGSRSGGAGKWCTGCSGGLSSRRNRSFSEQTLWVRTRSSAPWLRQCRALRGLLEQIP